MSSPAHSSPHWLDALTPPVETHIQLLVEAVTALLSRLDGTATETAPGGAARRRVQKVVDTMLGRPARVVSPGPVPGLAAAPGVARTIDGRRVGIPEDFYHRAYTFSHSGTHYARLSLRGYGQRGVPASQRLRPDRGQGQPGGREG